MNDSGQLSRALSADEASAYEPPPGSEEESPTTARADEGRESTAEVHRPGVLEPDAATADASDASDASNPRAIEER
ncbi:hypothetical protein [Agromyces binzhouensis]|uniref:hypothetical protein n=1 Tax=Agromyces binzhouensis TaxID=1817495 RepID=UPI00363BA138